MTTAPVAASILSDDARQRLGEIGSTEIVVGIPGFRSSETLRHVVATAAHGLAQYFPTQRALVLSVASKSDDQIRAIVERDDEPDNVSIRHITVHDPPGRGAVVRAIFEAMAQLGTRAGVLLNSDVPSITPEWIDLLAGPVIGDGFDFVAPNYLRHRNAGMLDDFIAYPVTRALYGVEVRHPLAGESGFSGDLLRFWLAQPVWDGDVARAGVDLWLTTTAIAEGFRIAQANLGVKARDRRSFLAPRRVFYQVVGTLFDLMERYAGRWQSVRSSALEIPPFYGELRYEEPAPVPLDVDWLFRAFKQGMGRYANVISRALAGKGVLPAAVRARAAHRFSPELWAPVVYRFALAYHQGRANHEELLEALMALANGRVSAALWESEDLDAASYEQYVVRYQAGLFQSHKQLLTAGWQASPNGIS
jgi:hypothetical protein